MCIHIHVRSNVVSYSTYPLVDCKVKSSKSKGHHLNIKDKLSERFPSSAVSIYIALHCFHFCASTVAGFLGVEPIIHEKIYYTCVESNQSSIFSQLETDQLHGKFRMTSSQIPQIAKSYPKFVGHPLCTLRGAAIHPHLALNMTWEELRQVPAPAGMLGALDLINDR